MISKSIQLRGLLWREIERYLKVPLQTIATPIVNSILYLLIFGVSLGGSIAIQHASSYLVFLVPGLIAMACIRNAFENSSSALLSQKYFNELQDLRVTPLTVGQLCFAKTVGSLTRGIFVALLTLLVGEGFYWATQGDLLPLKHPLLFIFFLLFGGMAFASLGIAVGMWSKSFEHIGAVSSLILLPLIYLGGVFFDLQSMAPLWQTLSRFNPLFYLIQGVREAMLGGTRVDLQQYALFAFIFFVLCYILALLSLKKGARYLR